MDGRLAEGSGENLFVIKDGKIVTNRAADSILMGINRDSVIEIARDLRFTLETKSLELEDLLAADEAFFTGTAAEVTPIREVDDTVIGAGKCGSITAEIQSAFFDAVNGRSPQFQTWLHVVGDRAAVAV